MVNIIVWSNRNVEIERTEYPVDSKEEMITLLRAVLDKAYYSGEHICLEWAKVDNEQGKAIFEEVDRWQSVRL